MIEVNEAKEFLLPTTAEGLDAMYADLVDTFRLPDNDNTYDMIATMVLHMPTGKAYATKAYFGNGVLKSMANKIAYEKLQELKAKRDAAEKAAADQLAETQPNSDASHVELIPDPGV